MSSSSAGRGGLAGSVAASVNARFLHGGPARTAREGGVMIHMLDDFEEHATPWLLSQQCQPFPVDHFSCSLIHANEPYMPLRDTQSQCLYCHCV